MTHLTKQEIQQVLGALEYHLAQTRPIPSTQATITLLQSKLAEKDAEQKFIIRSEYPACYCPACKSVFIDKQDADPVGYYSPDDMQFAHGKDMFKRGTTLWPLFTHPAPKQVPMTRDEKMDAFCHTPGIHQFVTAFFKGVEFAEHHHGISK